MEPATRALWEWILKAGVPTVFLGLGSLALWFMRRHIKSIDDGFTESRTSSDALNKSFTSLLERLGDARAELKVLRTELTQLKDVDVPRLKEEDKALLSRIHDQANKMARVGLMELELEVIQKELAELKTDHRAVDHSLRGDHERLVDRFNELARELNK